MKKVMPIKYWFPFKIGASGTRISTALMFTLACVATVLNAGTITVTNTADTGPDAPLPGTLRAALVSAAEGDTIDATGITGTITLMAGMTTKAQLVVDQHKPGCGEPRFGFCLQHLGWHGRGDNHQRDELDSGLHEWWRADDHSTGGYG